MAEKSTAPVSPAQRKVIRLFYAFQFFFSLLLWLPIFYEFQKRSGLTDPEIFQIQSIYYLAFCLFEIPTGYLADRFGRLNCVRAGALVLTLANFLPVLSGTYFSLLAHFLSIALARSLISGAASAYLYDFLHSQGASSFLYREAEGKARAYGLVGKVICWPAMGALMQWHLTLPYLLTTFASGVSIIFAFMLPSLEDGAKGQKQGAPSFQLAFRLLGKTPFLGLVILQGIAVFVLDRITQVNLFQPILEWKKFGVGSYGMILSLMTVFEAWGASHSGWIRRWMSDLNAVFVLTLMLAASLSGIALAGKIGVVVGLSVYALATGSVFPVQRQLLNDVIPDSRYRATLLSLESLVDRAVCAYVASFLGIFVSTGRVGTFIFIAATVTSMSVLILYLGLAISRPVFLRLRR